MKYTQLLFIFSIVLFSCKKQLSESKSSDQQEWLRSMLELKLSRIDFLSLDFKNMYITRIDSAELYISRIGFIGKDIAKEFIVVRTDENNNFLQGGYFHVELNNKRGKDGFYYSDGFITVTSLDKRRIMTTKIKNNQVVSDDPASITLTAMPGPPKPPMPEPQPPIIFPYEEDFDSPLMDFVRYLQSIGGNGPSNSMGGGYYWPANPVFNNNNWQDPKDPLYLLESYDGGPQIDFSKFAKCFNNIPDANASYSISIMVDIPNNNNPNTLFDWREQSPGHVFLRMEKRNESESVVQNIGFYPQSSFKALGYKPVISKLADDSGHEYNAALLMNLSKQQFSQIITGISETGKNMYDITRFNCTDVAMDIFNIARENKPLIIPTIIIPNALVGQLPSFARTPGELYKLLDKMKTAEGPESGNISIYPSGKRADDGHGACD